MKFGYYFLNITFFHFNFFIVIRFNNYFDWIKKNRPVVTIKIAVTLTGNYVS